MDVDKSIRILELVCCDDYKLLSNEEKEKIINDFYNIDKKNKPKDYRNLAIGEVRELFLKLNHELKKCIKNDFKIVDDFQIIQSTKNNKVGADAILAFNNNSTQSIRPMNLEMKFGSETLANIGQSKMDELFDLKDSNFSFKELNKEIKQYQRKMIDSGITEEDELIKCLKEILNKIVFKLLNLNLKPNNRKINEMVSLTGNRSDTTSQTIKYQISPKEIRMKHMLEAIDDWRLENISIPKDSSRIQIILRNGKISLKFLLNWKNNYNWPTKSSKKFSAKTGGTTSSWNVWLYII